MITPQDAGGRGNPNRQHVGLSKDSQAFLGVSWLFLTDVVAPYPSRHGDCSSQRSLEPLSSVTRTIVLRRRVMYTQEELNEYLEEIRAQVCSGCVERPPEGPPCTPLGKVCGVELHLPQLVQAIHSVRSGL